MNASAAPDAVKREPEPICVAGVKLSVLVPDRVIEPLPIQGALTNAEVEAPDSVMDPDPM